MKKTNARKLKASLTCQRTSSRSREALVRNAVRKDAASLLDTVAGFFYAAGMSRNSIARELLKCAERVRSREPRLEADTHQAVVQLAGALRQWWLDPAFLDDRGLPRALPLSGGPHSVESLLAKHVEPRFLPNAITALRKSVTIARNGLWRPQFSRPFVRAFGEDGTRRLQVAVAGVLQTFLRNQLSDRGPGQKNFDRTASVPSFPDALLPELRQRLNKLLMVTLEDVDRILSETDVDGINGARSEVGVSMLLYDFPQRKAVAPGARARNRLVGVASRR